MNSKFKISIPKPCHENCKTMTPKEKGIFCSSCSKIVVDFTKKSTQEIQEYLFENRSQKVCGHFYKKQLDAIIIEIPQATFHQQLSFQKTFILALFLVMGTTLFSCQYGDGKKQKIENVILVDTIKTVEEKINSLKNPIKKEILIIPKKRTVPPPPSTTGIMVCNTEKESIIDLTTTGDVIEVIETIGEVTIEYIEEEIILGFIIIEEPPRFKEVEKLSTEKAKEGFNQRMKKFVQENFHLETTINLGLREGKHKIHTQFIIDETGNVKDIKVRAPHKKIKKEVLKMLQKLPQFIPGKQVGKVVKTRYTLPIYFEVE